MPQERPGAVTFMGRGLTLVGDALKVGDKAPDFIVLTEKLSDYTIVETIGPRLFTTFPSLDTPVCDSHLKRLIQEIPQLGGLAVYAVSADLPFAQKRWADANGAAGVTFLSDYRDASFGTNWGVLIKEARLLARSVFILDSDDVVKYVDVVTELTALPDFDKLLAFLRQTKIS